MTNTTLSDKRNQSLMMDFYELTMSQVYFDNGTNEEVVFDLFYRRNPDNGGFAIFCGLDQIIDYVENFSIDADMIEYLRSTGQFSEAFLEYLSTVRFTGDLWAIPEGTPVFPYEPLIRVKAPLIEAQLIETAMLLAINHQTLIATKARRIVQAANGKAVMEFGARRAHNFDSSLYGARACYIAGVNGTATTQAGMEFGIPALGTMAHSFIQSFPSEYDAFMAYAKTYPESCTLLIDTYNTLHSGVKNAIQVAKDYLEPNGYRLKGVRIDSGDMAYLSKRVRKALDEAGMEDCSIVVSNSLDEYLIESLLTRQGARIDSFGVGENMIVSKHTPVFGGVYKLSAIMEEDGRPIPKIKISENEEKITNPGMKKLYRIYDKNDQMAIADLMTLDHEILDPKKDLTIYHPMKKWKYKTIEGGTYLLRELMVPIFIHGKLVYKQPTLQEIREYCAREQETLWEEIKRFSNPQEYYVDLSEDLLDLKLDMISQMR
ncbi:nicotinate phosphoribosyltransferase [Ileibacterium valens]|uniref:nicotinate phosphoribosyltransferase n=1 Tax=Ileibacterium valens TaxID=1862668 RepID=UPI0023521696|nr:nicotinate phosphoribosyltransferase [Ileibacterium valens]